MEDNFDEMEKRLKELVNRSEQNDLPIEEAFSIAKEGIDLSDKCLKMLKEKQEQFQNLVK